MRFIQKKRFLLIALLVATTSTSCMQNEQEIRDVLAQMKKNAQESQELIKQSAKRTGTMNQASTAISHHTTEMKKSTTQLSSSEPEKTTLMSFLTAKIPVYSVFIVTTISFVAGALIFKRQEPTNNNIKK
jgi:septal ring factor EnvC (AmiA/AmiB activator)